MRAKGYRAWVQAAYRPPTNDDYESWEKTWGLEDSVARAQLATLKSIVDENIPLTQPVRQKVTSYIRGKPYQDEMWDTIYNI